MRKLNLLFHLVYIVLDKYLKIPSRHILGLGKMFSYHVKNYLTLLGYLVVATGFENLYLYIYK